MMTNSDAAIYGLVAFTCFASHCTNSSPVDDAGVDAAPEAESADAVDEHDTSIDSPSTCTHNAQCANGVCARYNTCGPGVCQTGTPNCIIGQACGCDNKTYAMDCDAIQADVGVAYYGACE